MSVTSLPLRQKKTLEQLGLTKESDKPPSLNKKDEEKALEALKNLWLVSKGTPTNRVLKRIREHPDLRSKLEGIETQYFSEANKEERIERLTRLFIIVDERNSEYELTDKGMKHWGSDHTPFTMLDLGEEYAAIDKDQLESQEQIAAKLKIQEDDLLRKEKAHNIRQLFRAHLLMEKDVDYIVDDKKIVIIDEHTGRPQPGRRFSDGLHQAIEAKEHVTIQQETQTFATITLQNYFRMYGRLSGMTGTAITEAQEFKEIYKIDVLEIPTHKKCVRHDAHDEIYMTEREKYNAILKEILKIHKEGRPILIGTESVEVSEKISRILKQNHLPHTVLNAKHHEKEAEIIANAGQKGAITVSTNMAGRGTDIKLGEGIAEIGGLFVIGTSRAQSRRIDRQLRGRSARQGDPGNSKFYVCFEDSLLRLFASSRLTSVLKRFRPPEGEPVSASILNRSIETAQKRVEGRNYSVRKHTLEYDDVMNKHRQEIYSFRNNVLETEDPLNIANDILEDFSTLLTNSYLSGEGDDFMQLESYKKALMAHFPISFEKMLSEDLHKGEIEELIKKRVLDAFKEKIRHEAKIIAFAQKLNKKTIDPLPLLYDVFRQTMINSIDQRWQKHLLAIDHLRTEVSLRTIGQKDPLMEFKHEAYQLFQTFSHETKKEICHLLFSFNMVLPDSDEFQKALSQMQILGTPKDVQRVLEALP